MLYACWWNQVRSRGRAHRADQRLRRGRWGFSVDKSNLAPRTFLLHYEFGRFNDRPYIVRCDFEYMHGCARVLDKTVKVTSLIE